MAQQNNPYALSLTAAFLLLGLTTARAQDTPLNPLLPEPKTKEFLVNGSVRLEPTNNFNISGSYGIFQTNKLLYGISLDLADSPGRKTDYALGLFGNYHFPSLSPLLPFVGVNVGLAGGDSNSFSYGIQGGLKYFLSSNVALSITTLYRDYTRSGRGDDYTTNFGFAFYFR